MQVNKTQSHPNQIHFGTMKRFFYNSGEKIYNHTCLFRNKESSQKDVVNIILNRMEKPDKIDMKIFGCSDLSQFLSRLITMDYLKGQNARQKLFDKANVELVDIDSDVINRAKKHIIGLTRSDFEDIDFFFGFKQDKYFEKTNESHFLKNESREINNPSYKKMAMADEIGECACADCCPDWQPVEFYKINEELLRGVKIRQGDIRQDVKNMSVTPDDTRRIIEFSHGWYFLEKPERERLAFDLAAKTKEGDVLIMHETDLETSRVNKIFEAGFEEMDMENNFKFLRRT
jgi:hypothetical protein